MHVTVVAHRSEEYWRAVELRRKVLRWPLGMDYTDEQLAAETDDTHVIALDQGEIVGYLMLSPREAGMQMRQVAVDPDRQRGGVGRFLINEAEAITRAAGLRRMFLHARVEAVGFYEKLGYRTYGDEFVEIGIRHMHMDKQLFD